MLHCFLDHVAIIFADLTWFNIFSTVVSFIAVFATIYISRVGRSEKKVCKILCRSFIDCKIIGVQSPR